MTHEDALARLPELVGLHAAASDDGELSAHLAGCERCRARLDALRAVDGGLRRIDAPPTPSQRLENRILAIPAGAGAPERRRGGSRRLVAAAACVLLLVVAGAGVLATRDGSGQPSPFQATRVVQLASAHPDGVSARVEIGPADGARIPMRVVATGLPSGGDHYYGLWLTGADGAISGGSFRPDGKGECAVMMEVPSGQWTAVDVTEGDRPPSARTTMAGAPL